MADRIKGTFIAVGVAALLLVPCAAAAQTASCDSPEHQRGRQLREQGHDSEAYDVFRGLYEREHSGCAQARMGLALRALGRWAEAERAIQGALGQASDPWVARSRATLETELTQIREHVGELDVVVQPAVPGAELWLDGQRAATLPLAAPARVTAGSVVLEVRASGYETARRTVNVTAQQRTRETLTLVVAASARREGNEPHDVATPPAVAPVRSQAGGGGGMSALAWAGVIGGGVLVVAGGVLWGLAEMQYGSYTSDPACRTTTQSPEDLCAGRRADATLFRRIGITGLGVGAALAVTGVVLLVASPGGRSERAASVRVQCVPDVGSLGVSCVGVF